MRFFSILFYLLSSLLYYDYTNTHFAFAIFVVSLTAGTRSSVSIDHKNLSHNRTRNQMNGGGKSC